MGYKEKYLEWISSPVFDEKTKDELIGIAEDEKEIEDRFYKDLKFGTGGLRGVIGAGTNRMNVYTVTKATQGLADYIISLGEEAMNRGVAIAFDSRRMSPEFSKSAALTLNANGIRTYIFESLRPTPELSFAVRRLNCIAGLVVTASHNPPEYNGYKVYWEDGAQITPPHDRNIMEYISRVTDFADIKGISEDSAREKGLYNTVPESIDETYYSELIGQSIHPDIIKKTADELTVVYTPLNGTGNVPVREVLRRLGFTRVHTVEEQEKPDGNFPTVVTPNPENKEAFTLALKLAKNKDADLVLATDPDADRLGVYVKDENGTFKGTYLEDEETYPYVGFTGNMTGALLEEYILSEKKKTGTLPEKGVICSTVVSTNLARAIASGYGMEYVETLTGFKYIGEQLRIIEEEGYKKKFVFGLEESYGCLAGDYTRDKDACSAVVMLCEAAAYFKHGNRTLCDAMDDIYKKYGYYLEGAHSLTLKGADGDLKMKRIMENMRITPAKEIAGLSVVAVRDYQTNERRELKTGSIDQTGLPKSNVIYYELENDAWMAVRPSGTEPKVKFYCGVNERDMVSAAQRLERIKAYVGNADNFD